MTRRHTIRPTLAAVSLVATVALVGCSPAESTPTSSTTTLEVAAAFYPLQFVAERVGGNHVAVTALAPPGVEPHDLELSPVGVRAVRDADVVLYLAGFQPSVDDAIAATNARGFNAGDSVDLLPPSNAEQGSFDPHFWLDPTLLATFADAVGNEFATLDPANATEYQANAAALVTDLTSLDDEYSAGLAQCERDTILVSHEAFGYLARRYGLVQVGLSGLDPEAEPSPARIREVRDIAESEGATTVYAEALVDPSVVEAFARDAHLVVATLDPVESAIAPDDYLVIMNRNLTALEVGLGCG
jgi:zinc transport system substrate-binding protein